MNRKLVSLGLATLVGLGGLISAQPAFAATACNVYANTPTKQSSPGVAVKGTGGRTCDTSKSTTVYLKGVRTGLPDSVLAKTSAQLSTGSISATYGSPSSGAKYRTQTEDTAGAFAESAILTW